MRKLIGYTLFCIAIGMAVGLLVSGTVWDILLILILLLLGFNLFCCG